MQFSYHTHSYEIKQYTNKETAKLLVSIKNIWIVEHRPNSELITQSELIEFPVKKKDFITHIQHTYMSKLRKIKELIYVPMRSTKLIMEVTRKGGDFFHQPYLSTHVFDVIKSLCISLNGSNIYTKISTSYSKGSTELFL